MTLSREAENFLWVEKYRPKTIDQCILPAELKKIFNSIVAGKEAQNLLLCGGPGCGKTTVAKALCEQLNVDWIMINASENGNIDTLRTTIRNFASTVSLSGNGKVVILDESDFLNVSSTQPALRAGIEEFSKNCRFILTCNHKNRIIEPLQSRCSVIDFHFTGSEKSQMAEEFYARILEILKAEHVSYDEKSVAKIIAKYFPDFRRCIGEFQKFSYSGQLQISEKYGNVNLDEVIRHMKAKNFSDVRKWVSTNNDLDYTTIFRSIYDILATILPSSAVPQAVLIIAEYQYKMSFSADQEICMVACLAELMLIM